MTFEMHEWRYQCDLKFDLISVPLDLQRFTKPAADIPRFMIGTWTWSKVVAFGREPLCASPKMLAEVSDT